jgi:hypothetical protein
MSWNIFSNRIPGYQAIANRLNLSFLEEDQDRTLYNDHRSFKLFQRGGGKKIKYILYGNTVLNEAFQVFLYQFTISTGKSAHTYRQQVYSVMLTETLPSFTLRPENLFHRIGKWFGLKDINFDDYPEFSNAYLLKATREDEVRSIFNDQILGFLSYEKGWWIECNGSRIIYFKHGKPMDEEMVEPFIQVAASMHSLLVGKKPIEELSNVLK